MTENDFKITTRLGFIPGVRTEYPDFYRFIYKEIVYNNLIFSGSSIYYNHLNKNTTFFE